jgi:glyoxylase-like metal-dependent hydrolase (beta-lactamase superfamily II)
MIPDASLDISRRHFLTVGGMTVAAACLAPRHLIAQTSSIVPGAFKEAATAKVTIQNLRRNISVLLGAGGNIAVLTGPDGKLVVDAEIVTARPNVSKALASINADPIKQLINTHWHFDHTGGNEWIHEAGASILGARKLAKTSFRGHVRRREFSVHFPSRAGGCDSFHRLPR